MQFANLGLAEPILRAVASESYTIATPIQAQAIPLVLEGRDVLGSAQTGTGKTAAFALPILHRLSTTPRPQGPARSRVLVLCPTRELANQIADSFRVYGKNLRVSSTVIFGGVGQNPQVAALRRGVDIIIATPGRLLDLMEQGHVDLRGIEMLVLDEADRMLDMGFINDIRRIVAELPTRRQTLFFSATMPKEIRSLADSLLNNAAHIAVAPVSATAEGVSESVYFVARGDKPALLAHLYDDLPMARTIVFTRTKRGADRVAKRLHAAGIRAEAIHGDKTQNARERALANFRANKTPILIATDIASRGIDVDGITHVVNYDLTHEPETYVHRIGRTARAGASGMAVSFCDQEEVPNLRDIQKLIKRSIPVAEKHPYRCNIAASAAQGRSGAHHHRQTQPAPARPVQHERAPHQAPAHAPRPVHPLHAVKEHAVSRAHEARKDHAPARPHEARKPHAVAARGHGAVHSASHPRGRAPAHIGFNRGRPAGKKRSY